MNVRQSTVTVIDYSDGFSLGVLAHMMMSALDLKEVRIVEHSEQPQPEPPTIQPRNVNTPPYQPPQINPTPPIVESIVDHTTATATVSHIDDTTPRR